MDDGQILELIKRRNKSSVAEIEKKYGKLLFRLAAGILCSKEDAEEVVNDTLLAAWESLKDFQPDNLSAYLCKITRNLALKKYRYETAEKRNSNYTLSLEEIGDIFPSGNSPENMLLQTETKEAILSFVKTLDDRTRRIFLRRYWFFDSVNDIAAAFSLSEVNVRGILFRTRQKLKEYLIQEGVGI